MLHKFATSLDPKKQIAVNREKRVKTRELLIPPSIIAQYAVTIDEEWVMFRFISPTEGRIATVIAYAESCPKVGVPIVIRIEGAKKSSEMVTRMNAKQNVWQSEDDTLALELGDRVTIAVDKKQQTDPTPLAELRGLWISALVTPINTKAIAVKVPE